MIETFKIVSGKYDRCAAPILTGLNSSVTRGHGLRLEKFRSLLVTIGVSGAIEMSCYTYTYT